MSFERAERLLQTAYNNDALEGGKSPIELPRDLEEAGVMNVHRVYYDGGLAQNQEIVALIKEKPMGDFVRVIKALRDVRVKNGDYPQATLDKMYNLKKLPTQ